MPDKQEILAGLYAIANNYTLIAIFWHIIIFLIVLALILRWKPSNKLFSTLLGFPVLSVASLAWLSGNAFNGMVFSVLTVLTFSFGLRTNKERLSKSSVFFFYTGILMVAFSLVYPHFLDTGTFVSYFYASPAGLIPCPTLSLVIGFLLIYNGFGSKALTITFIVAGLFYSIFGVFKLGVYLDLVLLAGTLVLLLNYFIRKK